MNDDIMVRKLIERNNDLSSVEELLGDDNFIASRIRPSGETKGQWEGLMISNEEFAFANDFVLSSHLLSRKQLSDKEKFDLWTGIEVANKVNLRKTSLRQRLISLVSGAAVMLVAAMLMVGNGRNRSEPYPPLFVYDIPEAGADVKLYLDTEHALSFGGSEVVVEYGKEGLIVNDNAVTLSEESSGRHGSSYHMLNVPKGKRSRVTLSDGSVVWVNAGSRVAFPTEFNTKKREIYVDGKAYLEVRPDNKKSPFVVKTTSLDIEVTGTSFEVDSHDDRGYQKVVLVDGSVKVRWLEDHKREAVLKPGEMYTQSNGIQKIKKVDAGRLVSWKDGLLHYDSEMLGTIAYHLSQYYGYKVSCSQDVAKIKFSGKLDLKDDLDYVLNGLSQCAPISYRQTDSEYFITKIDRTP